MPVATLESLGYVETVKRPAEASENGSASTIDAEAEALLSDDEEGAA